MKGIARTALLLMLTAGSLVLPCVAQQEVNPDIYDATPRSSVTTVKKTTAAKPAAKPVAHHARAKHKTSGHVMLASAKTPAAK
jgi:hypothetical protein